MVSPRWLFLEPGKLLLLLGLIGYALSMPGVTIGDIRFSAHTLVFSTMLLLCGYHAILFAIGVMAAEAGWDGRLSRDTAAPSMTASLLMRSDEDHPGLTPATFVLCDDRLITLLGGVEQVRNVLAAKGLAAGIRLGADERDLQAGGEREALGLGDLEVARHARLRRFGREGRNRRFRRGLLHRLAG